MALPGRRCVQRHRVCKLLAFVHLKPSRSSDTEKSTPEETQAKVKALLIKLVVKLVKYLKGKT